MYLSKLEIFGFKSFPEKTKVEFAQGVSAIVGPNGSGKSNIVDALRWVLGEQGDRALRSEKRDDVVFSGTRTRKPLSIAEVSLTIDNSKFILPTEYREVQIARRFFRSGDTEYFLNGTKVRLKDIRTLFVDTGIGPDAYSVIELKMVETILSSVKNERRKMFEEASGIVSYKYNRDQTLKRLETIRENLLRVNDIIREKQRNLNMLERQVKKNEEAKSVFENLRKLEILCGNLEYKIYNKEIKDIQEHENENIELKEKLRTEISENDILLDGLNDRVNELDIQLSELSQKIEFKKEEINQVERLNIVAEQKSKFCSVEIERLTFEIENIKNNIDAYSIRKDEIEKQISILKNTLYASEQSLEEKKFKLDRTIEIITEKKNDIIHIGGKLKEINKSLNESKANYQAKKIKFENNLEKLNNISASTQTSLLDIEKFDKIKIELLENRNKSQSKLKAAEHELFEKTKIKSDLTEKIKKLELDISNNKLELQKKKSRISYLENLVDTFEDYAEGVQYLVKQSNYSGIQTVIDSIEVDDKFKIAIETALGEVSNYLILDNSNDLEKYIDALNNALKGKATFILQDKLFNNQIFYTEFLNYEPEFLKEFGVYGFADDFVQCKENKNEQLIKYLLDEYVIVEDLSLALRLSNDNYYKFISLDGDIVTDGVVRAGSKLNEDTIKLGRHERIISLKKDAKSYEEILQNKETDLNDLININDKIDLEHLKNSCTNFELELNDINNEISKNEYSIDTINKSISDDDFNYKKIQEENTLLNKTINELIEIVNKNDNEHSNLDKELTFITNEFDEIEKTYTEIQADYNSFNVEVLKLRNELKNEENNFSRICNTLEIQQKQIEKNGIKIQQDKTQLDEYSNTIDENREKLQNFKNEMIALQSDFDKIKSGIDKHRDEQNSINQEQRSRRLLFDRVSQKLIDSQVKIRENTIRSEQTLEFLKKKYEYKITDPDISIAEEPLAESFIAENGELDIDALRKSVEENDNKLKKLGGGYQQLVWDNFQTEKDELENIIKQRNDLTESEKEIKKTIEKINQEARERFLTTFEKIRENFTNIFKELFQEGDEANLKLIYEEDEDGKINDDPLEAKIEINAKPRGKRPTSIELLSGGEKTLTAIALLFAIYLVKPSPFCVLDEVDAPLDPANLGRFNKMIRKFSSNTQFILITHNERTMETVDRLYGVTMQEPGVTTIVETKFKNTGEKIQS